MKLSISQPPKEGVAKAYTPSPSRGRGRGGEGEIKQCVTLLLHPYLLSQSSEKTLLQHSPKMVASAVIMEHFGNLTKIYGRFGVLE